jgi:putative FmdB family regulatory protein
MMPTYLYECENCGRFEYFQKISDEPLQECPDCHGKVKRIIGAPGIIFKGSGFYSTDNRVDSSKKKDVAHKDSDKIPDKVEDKKGKDGSKHEKAS